MLLNIIIIIIIIFKKKGQKHCVQCVKQQQQ